MFKLPHNYCERAKRVYSRKFNFACIDVCYTRSQVLQNFHCTYVPHFPAFSHSFYNSSQAPSGSRRYVFFSLSCSESKSVS